MSVSLIAHDLMNQFEDLLNQTETTLNIVSPFIGYQTAQCLAEWLTNNPDVECTIITRFYREDFIEGVSSIYGLEGLLEAGAKLYALVDLHTKLYSFDAVSTIIGSANFTKGGFVSNHELCVLMEDEPEIAEKANEYFYDLLEKIQSCGTEGIVTSTWIEEEKKYVAQLAANQRTKGVVYSNEFKKGAILKKIVRPDLFESILEHTDETEDRTGIWLKFEGTGEDRVPGDYDYKHMKGSTSELLNTTYFPRRPSGIAKGDTLFITLVSYDEHNRPTPMIIGYAQTAGFNSKNIVDKDELKEDYWKGRFPYYVVFSDGKVIDAPIKNGIPLVDLYNSVGKATFPMLRKRTTVNQRQLQSMHYRRSHMQITQEAYTFLMDELNKRFTKYGEMPLG
ncbi:phospholipase D family protein [Paenibacillus hunanensis]|uniref:phospholipase D family protein n=1 Tax=Paenibacillus hunanensis TaxID=539262 RepID=UPI0020270B3F|nr:phospholipase D family protein [Paenibacillus hunanensis]MCL9662058.1 phospholipase D family protein [Paenibacillus hunanensis]